MGINSVRSASVFRFLWQQELILARQGQGDVATPERTQVAPSLLVDRDSRSGYWAS